MSFSHRWAHSGDDWGCWYCYKSGSSWTIQAWCVWPVCVCVCGLCACVFLSVCVCVCVCVCGGGMSMCMCWLVFTAFLSPSLTPFLCSFTLKSCLKYLIQCLCRLTIVLRHDNYMQLKNNNLLCICFLLIKCITISLCLPAILICSAWYF